MIAHEDAASACRDIFESTDIDLDAGRSDACGRNPHRNAIEPAHIANQQRVGDSNDPGDRTKSEIDKDELEGREHTTFKDTVVATELPFYLVELRPAIAFGSFW